AVVPTRPPGCGPDTEETLRPDVTSRSAVSAPWAQTRWRRPRHCTPPAPPAPLPDLPPRRVVLPARLRGGARPRRGHGAQPPRADDRRPLRAFAGALEPARPHPEGARRHGVGRPDRLP